MSSTPSFELNDLQSSISALQMLRPYQLDAANAVFRAHRPGKRTMVVMPTGGGKTWVISALTEMFSNKQVLIITPRRRLLIQTRAKLNAHGVLSSNIGDDRGTHHSLVVGTYQTMIRRKPEEPDVIIIDECHLVPPDSSYEELLSQYPNASVIGLTATPLRSDSHISSLGWETVYSISILSLVDQGFLVPPRSLSTGGMTLVDEDGVGIEVVDSIARTTTIIPKVVASLQKERRYKNLLFCRDIEHAEFVFSLLCAAGEKSVFVVHSKQSLATQDASIDNFSKSPGRSWLVNVALIGVGVDIPAVDAIVILRDVSSFALLAQIIGRGLRRFKGKVDCLVLDFGGGTSRYGFIDSPSIGDSESRGGTKCIGDAMKACKKCQTMTYIGAKTCCHCGYDFLFQSKLREDSVSVQLLSRDYLAMTVESTLIEKEGNAWRAEVFVTDGARRMSELSFTSKPPKPRFDPGARVLAERIAGSIVRILH